MRFIKGDSLKEAIDHFHSLRSLQSPSPLVGEGQGGMLKIRQPKPLGFPSVLFRSSACFWP
jgi:hypothetical protein